MYRFPPTHHPSLFMSYLNWSIAMKSTPLRLATEAAMDIWRLRMVDEGRVVADRRMLPVDRREKLAADAANNMITSKSDESHSQLLVDWPRAVRARHGEENGSMCVWKKKGLRCRVRKRCACHTWLQYYFYAKQLPARRAVVSFLIAVTMLVAPEAINGDGNATNARACLPIAS